MGGVLSLGEGYGKFLREGEIVAVPFFAVAKNTERTSTRGSEMLLFRRQYKSRSPFLFLNRFVIDG